MQPKHTRGPWKRINATQIIDIEEGTLVAEAYSERKRRSENAALIAAAPELLEALEAILAEQDLIYTGGERDSLEKAGMAHTDALASLARAAIKKARGE